MTRIRTARLAAILSGLLLPSCHPTAAPVPAEPPPTVTIPPTASGQLERPSDHEPSPPPTPKPVVVYASWAIGPYLAVDHGSVYWTQTATVNGLRKIAHGGGEPTDLWRGGQRSWQLMAHEGEVFFSRAVSGAPEGAVMRVASTGGPATTLVANIDGPDALAVDASGVYYATAGELRLLPHDEDASQTLLRGLGRVTAVSLDAKVIYYDAGGALHRLAKSGGKPQELGPSAGSTACSLLVDSRHAYLSNRAERTIVRMPLSGRPTEILVRDVAMNCLAQDARDLYWTTHHKPARVMRTDKRSGATETLAEPELVSAIAVSDNDIFYLTHGGQVAIMRLAKPAHPVPRVAPTVEESKR